MEMFIADEQMKSVLNKYITEWLEKQYNENYEKYKNYPIIHPRGKMQYNEPSRYDWEPCDWLIIGKHNGFEIVTDDEYKSETILYAAISSDGTLNGIVIEYTVRFEDEDEGEPMGPYDEDRFRFVNMLIKRDHRGECYGNACFANTCKKLNNLTIYGL